MPQNCRKQLPADALCPDFGTVWYGCWSNKSPRPPTCCSTPLSRTTSPAPHLLFDPPPQPGSSVAMSVLAERRAFKPHTRGKSSQPVAQTQSSHLSHVTLLSSSASTDLMVSHECGSKFNHQRTAGCSPSEGSILGTHFDPQPYLDTVRVRQCWNMQGTFETGPHAT